MQNYCFYKATLTSSYRKFFHNVQVILSSLNSSSGRKPFAIQTVAVNSPAAMIEHKLNSSFTIHYSSLDPDVI